MADHSGALALQPSASFGIGEAVAAVATGVARRTRDQAQSEALAGA